MLVPLVDVDNIQEMDFKIHRPDGSCDFLFVLFKSPALVMADGEYKAVDKGKCIIFDKHKIHSYFPKCGHRFVHDFIHFDSETDYENTLISSIPKGVLINISLPQSISSVLSEIKYESTQSIYKYKNDIISNLTAAFLHRIKSAAEADYEYKNNSPHFEALYSLRSRIYLEPVKALSIDQTSKLLCMSRSHFQYLYKQLFSISYTKDVISARLSYAKLLLSSSNIPIYEVAAKCGYSNTEHFIRQFKKEIGMTPEKFRYM